MSLRAVHPASGSGAFRRPGEVRPLEVGRTDAEVVVGLVAGESWARALLLGVGAQGRGWAMSARVWPARSLAMAALLLLAPAASAQPPVVAVAGDPPADAARARLIEELEAQGYEVVQADREEARVGLSARLIVGPRRIEVRVVNRRNGGVERREAVIQLGPNEDDTASAAIRAAEYLRASLIEVGASAPSKPAPPAPGADVPHPAPRPTPKPVDRPSSTVHAGLGPGVLYSIGGLAAVPSLEPSIRWRTASWGGVRLNVMVPLASSSVSRDAGSVAVKTTAFGLSIWGSPIRSKWVEPHLELGVHAFFLSMTSSPAAGYEGEDHSRVIGAALAGAGLALFPSRIRLRLAVSTGPTLEHEHVNILRQQAARWGEWLVSASAMVEAGLD